MDQPKFDMHLILNTHWDREYRWGFRETQMRLLEAGDILIDTMEKDPRFKYFHPDSQASFLDDYLEFRPENRERVKKLVSAGRILAGPWYTLPSEFMVSGEALVRNLLMGHRIAGDLGGVMKCAYNIFSWGQVSQLPQIYRQFGMDTILFYRGIDQSKIDKLEFWWDAPDGSRALGITFGAYHRLNFWIYVYNPYIKGVLSSGSVPGGGYDLDCIQKNGGVLTRLADPYSTEEINHHVYRQPSMKSIDSAMAGMQTLLDSVKDKSSTRQLLFLQGFDQENPDPVIPDLVEAINQRIDYGQIRISSLPEYVSSLRKELVDRNLESSLPMLKGEMLSVESSDDAFAPLYIGTYSARMPLKLRNADCQYRLERWAEPVSVWQCLSGSVYPELILRSAWKELLQNQQHDGIGGCHIDRVQLAMEERYRTVYDIAEAVTRDGLNALTAEIDYSHLTDRELGVTVFNTAAFAREEAVTVTIDVPLEWGLRKHGDYSYPVMIELEDADGAPVPVQILGIEDETVYGYLKYGNAIRFAATRITVAFIAQVPSMGYATFKACPKAKAHRPVASVSPALRVLENRFLRAEILPDGSIDLLDKASGRLYPGLNVFEDGGESGGPLIYSPPNGDAVFSTEGLEAQIAKIYAGPVSGAWRIDREWMLPDGLDEIRKTHVPYGADFVEYGARRRSAVKKAVILSTEVTLSAGSRMLEFKTTIENTITDHRLRVCFPTGMDNAAVCHVDSPFDVVERPIAIPDSTGWYEAAARTLPTSSFVDVSDGEAGLAVLHYGLSEYEVTDDASRTVALTLLRCFGTAGNPTETFVPQHLAQCQGKHVFRYAVMPHDGNWSEGRVLQSATAFTTPLRATVCTAHTGALPRRHSFFTVESSAFAITALKKAESGEGIVLRGFNSSKNAAEVGIAFCASVSSVEKITMEEKPLEPLAIENDRVKFEAGKGEVVSLLMKMGNNV